tara:strand:- start:8235 stop:9047 length:813 start_codon:yes stop_codon:yes gene_type:complete
LRRYLRTAFYTLCIIATLLATVNLVVQVNAIPWLSQVTNTAMLRSDIGGRFPIESFVMIEQEVVIYKKLCNEENESCVNNGQIEGIVSGSASGSIVGNCGEDCSLVLTAAHVCAIDTSAIPITDPAVDYKITLTTGFGRISQGTIIATDEENDLCIVMAEDYLGPSLTMSDKNLVLHQDVYNMASPLGLAVPMAVPVFRGFYSGEVDSLAIFTFPVAPGSSGSPVLNEDGELIATISGAAINFDEFAIGSRTEAVRNFLSAVEYQLGCSQ